MFRSPRPAPRLAPVLLFFVLVAGCHRTRTAENVPPPIPSAPAPPPQPERSQPAAPAAFDPNVFAPISVRAQSARIPVIMYHDIVKRRGKGSVYFDVTREEFAAQMDFLTEQGATPITLDQLHRHLTRGEPVPSGAVVLTFDDNYQGFYENAYPLLRERGFPAAVFVHTDYVGDKKGAHPKMDWDTLRSLDKEGIVTVGSHTCSHPEDMRLLTPQQQERELNRSKEILEKQIGHKIPYFAYPIGRYDRTTLDLTQRAGYTMAFTMANGPAEQSPGILQIRRTISTRLEQAWKECQDTAINAPAAIVDQALRATPVQLDVGEYEGVKLGLVRGGLPSTHRAAGRQSVGQFIQEAKGVAGINGTFFADAALRGTDNTLIGPCLTASERVFYPEYGEWRLPRLLNRPLVLWGPTRIAILPFQPDSMNAPEPIQAFMPDVTDVFLAGAWIVHNGSARTNEEMQTFAVGDFKDPRRRAFFGLNAEGEVVLGGSLEVVNTEQLAQAAAAAGVVEAVLLDSGFSTSLVYAGKIIVTGHTARNLPSRPVPHAIVLSGKVSPPVDPEILRFLKRADPAVELPGTENKRRRRR